MLHVQALFIKLSWGLMLFIFTLHTEDVTEFYGWFDLQCPSPG